MVGKVALRELLFFLALRFAAVSIMPPVLPNHPTATLQNNSIEFDQLFIDTKSTYGLQVGIPDGD